MMEKFPVTSQNGNEYLVKAEYTQYLIGDVLAVMLYKKVPYKYLWKEKTKLVKVYSTYFEKDEDNYHNIVGAVNEIVDSYETKVQTALEQEVYQKNLLERSARELKDWDGVCK